MNVTVTVNCGSYIAQHEARSYLQAAALIPGFLYRNTSIPQHSQGAYVRWEQIVRRHQPPERQEERCYLCQIPSDRPLKCTSEQVNMYKCWHRPRSNILYDHQ